MGLDPQTESSFKIRPKTTTRRVVRSAQRVKIVRSTCRSAASQDRCQTRSNARARALALARRRGALQSSCDSAERQAKGGASSSAAAGTAGTARRAAQRAAVASERGRESSRREAGRRSADRRSAAACAERVAEQHAKKQATQRPTRGALCNSVSSRRTLACRCDLRAGFPAGRAKSARFSHRRRALFRRKTRPGKAHRRSSEVKPRAVWHKQQRGFMPLGSPSPASERQRLAVWKKLVFSTARSAKRVKQAAQKGPHRAKLGRDEVSWV